jgi:hypothetical protein
MLTFRKLEYQRDRPTTVRMEISYKRLECGPCQSFRHIITFARGQPEREQDYGLGCPLRCRRQIEISRRQRRCEGGSYCCGLVTLEVDRSRLSHTPSQPHYLNEQLHAGRSSYQTVSRNVYSCSLISTDSVVFRADPSTIHDKFLVGYQGWYIQLAPTVSSKHS